MLEPVRVDRQVYLVMGTGVRGQLSSDGVVQGLHEMYPQVVRRSCFTVLFQDSVILTVIYRVPPTAAPSSRL